jgi:peptidoglycan/LPS O-acetylase OafA/YrhL
MPPATQNRSYYPALDGLRGLAILLVVVYHNFGFIDYFFFGWLGVDLFFVLSGFLITDILIRTLNSPHYLRNFYARRVLRIFPLYYLTLVLFLIIIPRINVPLDVKYYTDNQVWLWTYLQNWLYVFKPSGSTNTLHHLWSLAVEEQFYLVWPLVILAVRKLRPLFIIISLVLLCVLGFRLWIWVTQVADLAYFNLYTFTRIDGICIGCMVALLLRIDGEFLKRNTWFIVLMFAILNFAFFFINRSYDFSFPYLSLVGYTTIAMMFGLLVNEAVTRSTKMINVLFGSPVLRFFGRISYGFYIFHWPVYLLLTPVFLKWFSANSDNWSQFWTSVLATAAAILVSWLSYQYYEKPFLRLKDRFE